MSLPVETHEFPATLPSLAADLAALGVQPGMVLVVHSSLKALGWVNGGSVAVILALEQVLGPEGTLVMPTHTADLSDPANWVAPPVPASWWERIRASMPAYDRALTPTFRMGVIPETFRKQTGVQRSANPDASFAAWGKHAQRIIADHALFPLFGERSPLARVYELEGWVLLLGGRARQKHLASHRGGAGADSTWNHTSWLADDGRWCAAVGGLRRHRLG
jgi:aminoglycoside 3-N-acetyltransferase